MRYLIANWKMNLPPEGIAAYSSRLREVDETDCRFVICPPFTHLREAAPLTIGAQNCSDQLRGAFTGEVSPSMLKDLGTTFVILGHSERRTFFGETDSLIARKLQLAIETGLRPVLCVGEDLRTRQAGQARQYIADQIKAVVCHALDPRKVLVAYEPIWAIGTGLNATSEICNETVSGIREAIARFWPAGDVAYPILYGGSVTAENAGDLSSNAKIDGFLVGGASLDSAKLLAIRSACG